MAQIPFPIIVHLQEGLHLVARNHKQTVAANGAEKRGSRNCDWTNKTIWSWEKIDFFEKTGIWKVLFLCQIYILSLLGPIGMKKGYSNIKYNNKYIQKLGFLYIFIKKALSIGKNAENKDFMEIKFWQKSRIFFSKTLTFPTSNDPDKPLHR